MAYVSVTTLKEYLGLSSSGDDTLLTNLLTRAQQIFDTETHRTFEAAADSTKTFDAGKDVDGLSLDWIRYGLDLCAITTVTNGDGVVVASSSYVPCPRHSTPYYGIRLKANIGLYWQYDSDPEDAISITGKWAYSTTAPADVVAACIDIASLLYKQRDTNSDLNRTVIAGNATLLPAGLAQLTQNTLKRYKRLI